MPMQRAVVVNSRRGEMKPKRPASFHGRIPVKESDVILRRPKTQTELLPWRGFVTEAPATTQRLTKLLLNVTFCRSLGALHVVMSPECTVEELVREAVRVYAKEGRRPVLTVMDPKGFDLHYSQFSLERLDPKEKLIELGSRNFFVCPKPLAVSTCSNEAENAVKSSSPPWRKYIEFLR